MNGETVAAVARKLCEIRGLDPDERVGHGHPAGYAVMCYSPRWKLVAREVQARMEMDEALAEAGS